VLFLCFLGFFSLPFVFDCLYFLTVAAFAGSVWAFTITAVPNIIATNNNTFFMTLELKINDLI
jgi:hypothetical protein